MFTKKRQVGFASAGSILVMLMTLALTLRLAMLMTMKKRQVGSRANLGFAAAGSTLGWRKKPIKQLTWSKGKQQLVTIIICYVVMMIRRW